MGSLMITLFATVALLLVGIHFLPTFIAVIRANRHALLIFVLNLLFGWTIIGWFVLLVWAAVGEERSYGPSRSFA
jgi:hypothetical protein